MNAKIRPDLLIAGVDEAGRGPLAGPVVAAAVILNPQSPLLGLRDSKKLSPKKREYFEVLIKENAVAWALASATVEEIDEINILQASLLAMRRAIIALSLKPTKVLVDGNRCPSSLPCECEAIIGGDNCVDEISAASILAKVARDREMLCCASVYPEYGFAKHKGYPTRQHIEALGKFGACAIHRRSFAPVKKVCW